MAQAPQATAHPAGGDAHDTARHRIHSETLLQGQRQVELVHQGETYRLQVTRLGKLILTK